ncbi:hypothetical protein [Enterovirga sp.]|uniref:hypothetical protein n=1 Tax=Enterovirga sp. TaxID=2026350 RepID=UPI00261321D1|nr:hypothetical protein [Enterovirga sp.]MDB5591341.1 hypothetical protein [Enterovirga sp.]
MKSVAIAAFAALLSTAAIAQTSTTVTREEGPLGDRTTVTKQNSDVIGTTTKRTTETTGSVGCDSKSVTKTNEFGDTRTKTKVEC